jgi:transcriptional regulator of acetoin/glycerol metabolism
VKDDLISDIMKRLLALCGDSFSEAQALQIEEQLRQEYGGCEHWISPPPKVPKQAKEKAVTEYLEGKPINEVIAKNGISRATLYRHLKKGD